MSCPPEATWLLYVDGESDDAQRHALDAHLVGCRDCRRAVVALRDESALISDALLERERPARVAARPRAPEPGVAIGLPAAIAAVTAALAAAGFLLETRVPGGLDHLNPLNLKGAYEMAFDLLFLARNRVPGLIELALSIGAMASVSAILTLGVGVIYRRAYGAMVLALLAVGLATPQPARALHVQFDQDTRVESSQRISETMLLSGDRVHIDGVVEGDVWVAAERVVIGGTVQGNVYCLCRDLELTGRIEGSIHGGIEHARLDGEVVESVYAASESLTLSPDGVVGRDLALIAETGLLGGTVGRDVLFGGDELELRSSVGRNVDVRWADRVALSDDARVNGKLVARVRDEQALERSAGAQVVGGVSFEEWHHEHRFFDRYRKPAFYAMHGLGLVAAFLFGLLLRWLAPRLMESDLSTSPQFLRSLGWGFVVLVATPIAIVLLGLTVVGLPVAVLAAFTFIVMIYSAELLVAAWIGRTLLPPGDESWLAWSRSFFVGLAVLTVATHLPIPFVGAAIMAVALLIGTGLFFQALREAAVARI